MLAPLHHCHCFVKLSLSCLVIAALIPSALAQRKTSEPTASVAEMVSRAESGDTAAQQHLFNLLSQGDPADPGYDLTLAWARSLASQDDPNARFLLGSLYEHGRGVPRDYTKAAENYEAAAAQGHANAQNNLAFLYLSLIHI